MQAAVVLVFVKVARVGLVEPFLGLLVLMLVVEVVGRVAVVVQVVGRVAVVVQVVGRVVVAVVVVPVHVDRLGGHHGMLPLVLAVVAVVVVVVLALVPLHRAGLVHQG